MVLNNMVGNLYTQISSDPGIITYLEGPECGDGNPHWAVRAAASIALLIKVAAIAMAIMSVILLSYLGIMMSWGLAFGLPWTLAYFYFIWICPAHQLSMGIRKLKPYRMLWLVSSIGVHIVLLLTPLTSFTTFSSSYLHIHQASHTTPVIVLATISALLALFQVLVIYAFFLVKSERRKCNRETSEVFRSPTSSSLRSIRSSSSPPPPYSEVASSPAKSPPDYEEVCENNNNNERTIQ